MPIFDEETPAQINAREILEDSLKVATYVADRYVKNFNKVWRNPDGIPAADTVAAMGTKALEIFEASAITKAQLMKTRPALLPVNCREPLLPVTPEIVNGQPTGRMIVG